MQGVAVLARRHRLPVYLSHGTRRGVTGWDDLDIRPFNSHENLRRQRARAGTGAA
jgi:hypothetical protein